MSVLDRGTVRLGGTTFPIRGEVTLMQASAFPAKLVTGDYTRDDEQLASSYFASNFVGGHGLRIQSGGSLPEVAYFSTLDTRYQDQVHLLPELKDSGIGLDASGKKMFFVQVAGTPFIVHNTLFWRWSGTNWLVQTISGSKVASDAFFAQDSNGVPYLIILTTDKRLVYVNTAGTQTLSAVTPVGTYGACIGSTLYAWDDSFGLVSGSAPGFSGRAVIAGPGGPAGVVALRVYANDAGNQTPWVIARNGTFYYDGTTLLKPSFAYPYTPASATASTVWQGALYVAVGTDVLRYEGSGRTGTLTNIGLTRLGPTVFTKSAVITHLVGDNNYLYALVWDSGLQSTPASTFTLAWNAQGWHTLAAYLGTAATGYMNAAGVLSDGTWARLYLHRRHLSLENLWYLDLSPTRYNPLDDTTSTYSSSGSLITPWFHGGWQELTKVGTSLGYRLGKALQSGEEVKVEYQVDQQGSDWSAGDWNLVTRLTAGTPLTGRIALPNPHDPRGLAFSSIRFRVSMSTTSNTSTPVLRYLQLRYVKVLDVEWGYAFEVDATQGYGGLSPRDLGQRLLDLASSREMLEFVFTLHGTVVRKRVRVTRISGTLETGIDDAGRYLVSVVEIG